MAEHTPTPWQFESETGKHSPARIFADFDEESSVIICEMVDCLDDGESVKRRGRANEDAAYIVRACNAYDALVATICELASILERDSEANDPGSDVFTALHTAYEILRQARAQEGA